ncbi:MAG TPA: hypothetical protein VF463_08570 [Sphingobium sp.]
MVEMKECAISGFAATVMPALSPTGESTIGFTSVDGFVVISMTWGNTGLCVRLDGDEIDLAATLFANAVFSANAHELGQSVGGVQ